MEIPLVDIFYFLRFFITQFIVNDNYFDNGNTCLPVNEELRATGKFEVMDLRVDEAEHSMEMHLPYLAKVFNG